MFHIDIRWLAHLCWGRDNASIDEGLHVVLDLHDYQQGGSPYWSGANMPKPESVAFWKAIATHYLNNTMVMFDEYNEPHYPSSNQWLMVAEHRKAQQGKQRPLLGCKPL